MPDNVIEIEKADITVTPPGGGTIPFVLIEGNEGRDPLPSTAKRGQDDIYYQIYRKHPIVRSAIDKKAKVASTNGYKFEPVDQSGTLNEERAKEIKNFLRRSGDTKILFQTFQDAMIYGRGFWCLEWQGGKPWKARRLHPKYTDWYSDGKEITGYRYGPVAGSPGTRYKTIEIVQFTIPDPDDDVMGLSPLESLVKTVAIDLFAMDFNASFFENNAQTGIIFQITGATETELIRNRAWLEQHYIGTANAHKPLLLEGSVAVTKSVATKAEMQYIEGRKMNREEILAVLDVPPEKIGLREDSNRSTASEGANTFRSESVRPLQTIIEERINNYLILELFEYDDILFAFNEIDTQEEMANLAVIAKAQSSGLLNTDEGRGRLGYGKIGPGGEIHFIQTAAGLIPLDMLKRQAEVALEASELSLIQTKRLAEAPLPTRNGFESNGQARNRANDGPGVQPEKPVGGSRAVNPNRPGSNSDGAR